MDHRASQLHATAISFTRAWSGVSLNGPGGLKDSSIDRCYSFRVVLVVGDVEV
jgi:hypothetical protein